MDGITLPNPQFALTVPQTVATVPLAMLPDTIRQDILKDMNALIPQIYFFGEDLLRRIVPVRSGKLLDSLLLSLYVIVMNNTFVVSIALPMGYPAVVKNPEHTMSIGWGRKYTPVNQIANRVVLRETPKGAWYLLNDPLAWQNFLEIFDIRMRVMIEELIRISLATYRATIHQTFIPTTYPHPILDPVVDYNEMIFKKGQIISDPFGNLTVNSINLNYPTANVFAGSLTRNLQEPIMVEILKYANLNSITIPNRNKKGRYIGTSRTYTV